MTKEYREALAALESKATLREIRPFLDDLAGSCGLEEEDAFGLTISMRAAAHGRLDVVEAACALGDLIERHNSKTGANLLHYAAQQPDGGAAIVEWAVKKAPYLLDEQILVPGERRGSDQKWDRGNGHTVAFEAVFNNNQGVVETLLELDSYKVDFQKQAVHGLTPLGWAWQNGADDPIANLLKSRLDPDSTIVDSQAKEEQRARQYAEEKDKAWRLAHREDHAALDLADDLRQYVLRGNQGSSVEESLDRAIESGVELDAPYGRFGQPLLVLVPTHPNLMKPLPKEEKDRYTEVVRTLIARGADPRTPEKGLMEVSAGFREVFFGYMHALELMIESIDQTQRTDFLSEQGLFNGYTRLIDAALIGNTEAITLLLRHSAPKDIRGFNGWTPCDAARNGKMARWIEALALVCGKKRVWVDFL